MNNLYLIGFVQALFFSSLILTKKGKKLKDYVLSAFIFLLGGQLLFIYSYYSGLYPDYPSIIIIDIYYWTLLGPALLVYTELVRSGRNKFSLHQILYFIPTLIVTIGFYKYIFIDGSGFFSDQARGWFGDFTIYVWFYNSPVFYIITILLLYRHKKDVRNYYSYFKNVDLKWLHFLSHGFAAFLLLMVFGRYINDLLGITLPRSYSYSWAVMVLYIFGIGYYGYRQKGVFAPEITETADKENRQKEYSKPYLMNFSSSYVSYKNSGLSNEEADKIAEKLRESMIENELFLDPELDLQKIADKLSTTKHKVSQVINEKFEKNFFEFVNEYRINYVKTELLNPEKSEYKIIAIAYEAGFNSKSTFYTLFKKQTSLTPAEYRKKYEKQAV